MTSDDLEWFAFYGMQTSCFWDLDCEGRGKGLEEGEGGRDVLPVYAYTPRT